MKEISEGLQKLIPKLKLKTNESLSKYTYTKTGGPADIFITPSTAKEVQQVIAYCHKMGIPFTILGNGSNLIVKDGGVRGVVLYLDSLNKITREGSIVRSGSGAKLIHVSYFALDMSLSGLEFACGIPGSIGGALYMNAGAYGGEMSDVLQRAKVLTKTGEMLILERDQLEAKYRHSVIASKKYIVLEAELSLEPSKSAPIAAKMLELTNLRKAKQPLEYPSCGSVFKRPEGYFAGKLIQDSGLQGKQIGGAQVSLKHAGFIINVGGATATDYLNLIELIQATVKEKFDIDLETEVEIIGEDLK